MSGLKIQGSPGMNVSIPSDDLQTAKETLAAEDSLSGSTMQSQEARQAVEVAKSRLGDIRTTTQFTAQEGPQAYVQYNPKELRVDKPTLLHKSTTSSDMTKEADSSSTKKPGILYNGHAGLGNND